MEVRVHFIFNNIKRKWHSIVVDNQDLIELIRSKIRKVVKVRIIGIIYMHRQEVSVHRSTIEIVVSTTGRVDILEEHSDVKYWYKD